MKEISEELEKRNCLICITCGAIFEGVGSIFVPCPACDAGQWGLRWITPHHGWIEAWSKRYKEALDELATT